MLKDFARTSPVTFFALPIIIIGLLVLSYFLYSTLLNTQIDSRSAYLNRQLEISIDNIDGQIREFEQEAPYLAEVDDFQEVFDLNSESAGKLRYRIKRMGQRYRSFIDTLFIYNKEQFYFVTSDSNRAIEEGFGKLYNSQYPLQFCTKPKIIHIQGSKALAIIPTNVLDTGNKVYMAALFDMFDLIAAESRNQYIGEHGYKLIFSENNGFRIFQKGREVEYEFGMLKSHKKKVIDDLLLHKQGRLIHSATLQGKVFLTTYQPFELFSERFGLVFSVAESDFISPIRTKLQVIFLSFFIIIGVVIIVFIINLRDISRNNDQLENSREGLARALTILEAQQETSREGLVVADENRNVVSSNKHFRELFNFSERPVRGTSVNTYLNRIKELSKDEQEVGKVWDQIRLDPEGRISAEFDLMNGKSVDFYSAPILDETGVNNGRIWAFQDISDRKKQIKELEGAREEALSGAREKENFLSIMSHEIRTPLNSIVGFTNLMLQGNPREDQRDQLEPLKYSADSLLNLINDILDLTKIESGVIQFEKIPFNLNEKLNMAGKVFGQSAKEKGLEIKMKLDDRISPMYLGDYNRLNQIVYNLVSNATKFTTEGSIQIGSRFVRKEGNKEVVNFWVKDTGIGIEREKLDEIFNSFSQADTNTTREYGGTGLGLAITKKLVELQGGSIWVKSILDQGSTFSIEMEYELTEKIEQKKNVIANDVDLKGIRIMVVEDNPFNQKVVNKFLERWGAKTTLCESGEMALGIIQDMEVDAILMDLQMPEMDGYETTRAIRALNHPYFKNIPIIAMSADALGDVKEKVAQAGMNNYVSKPFDPDMLFSLLVEVPREQA